MNNLPPEVSTVDVRVADSVATVRIVSGHQARIQVSDKRAVIEIESAQSSEVNLPAVVDPQLFEAPVLRTEWRRFVLPVVEWIGRVAAMWMF